MRRTVTLIFVTVRPAVDFSSLEFVLIVKTAGTQ